MAVGSSGPQCPGEARRWEQTLNHTRSAEGPTARVAETSRLGVA